MVTPEEAAAYEFTAMEQELIRQWQGPLVVGDPATVRAELAALVERYRVDELMLTTMVHGHDDRLRSYELVAEAAGLEAPTDAAADERAAATARST
jgi:alkanesulfonate monooxygenase SsuD/methylene tetrahydromethanopterin reductase-like flavin-dependent oxidoreductase (luciferase family)